jgi:bifunctional non-homologous end joining protein LigD
VSLTVYNKKRKFNETPEPASLKKERRKPGLTFVVQKHDATRLHYDFRLEMEGVLKSWAIPKGPSMVPGVKRLAIMVEDHPLAYGKFYGEIPEGNYGAGRVEIWDKGTYIPAAGKDGAVKSLPEMLKNGDIKFSLKGTYLKGLFALFRIKGSEKENEWMLVKKADEFAEEKFDIGSMPPIRSKKSPGRGKVRIKKHSGPFPDKLPEPMLARLAVDFKDDPEWIYEIKLDGYRMMCSVRDRKVDLVSRNGNSYNTLFKVLLDELGKIEEDSILDGEVVIEDPKGISRFQLLQDYRNSGKGILKYYVFDILYLNGHSLTGLPLIKRRELIDALFGKYDFTNVLKLEYRKGHGKELFHRSAREGFEGIMAKDPQSAYLPGKRSDSWLKVKSFQMQEVIICGYMPPQGSRKFFGSIIMGVNEDGQLKYAGNCGTGFNETSLKELYARFVTLKTGKCPFSKPPGLSRSRGKPQWITPRLVASIKFMEWTDGEIMRSPVFIGLREDKDPEEVVNETKGAKEVAPSRSAGSATGEETVLLSGQKVRLTNTSKIYWSDEGYTKGDLISYYRHISSIILPYLKDRPQSLNRYPHGIKGQNFYQKEVDPGKVPGWIKTAKMESGSRSQGIDYLICNDEATLIYMINLGCIELNPWHSTYLNPDYPTYMVLDLDPGDISFKDVIDAALVIKELCDEIKIPGYCKTSGATGLHVYIPLGSAYRYDQIKIFAEILANLTHSRLPSTTSIERPVAKRKNKVYIDFMQNRKGQTIAAPYSVRPRPFATVSAPLSWKEVNQDLSPEMFTIKNLGRRLEKMGDLWQPVSGHGISLPEAIKAIEKLS